MNDLIVACWTNRFKIYFFAGPNSIKINRIYTGYFFQFKICRNTKTPTKITIV